MCALGTAVTSDMFVVSYGSVSELHLFYAGALPKIAESRCPPRDVFHLKDSPTTAPSVAPTAPTRSPTTSPTRIPTPIPTSPTRYTRCMWWTTSNLPRAADNFTLFTLGLQAPHHRTHPSPHRHANTTAHRPSNHPNRTTLDRAYNAADHCKLSHLINSSDLCVKPYRAYASTRISSPTTVTAGPDWATHEHPHDTTDRPAYQCTNAAAYECAHLFIKQKHLLALLTCVLCVWYHGMETTSFPTGQPTDPPTVEPTNHPTHVPTGQPTLVSHRIW